VEGEGLEAAFASRLLRGRSSGRGGIYASNRCRLSPGSDICEDEYRVQRSSVGSRIGSRESAIRVLAVAAVVAAEPGDVFILLCWPIGRAFLLSCLP
jgi:hypothetical protein